MLGTTPHPSPVDVLSVREREIMSLVALGWSNTAIRRKLWITNKTLDSHMRRIYQKLDLPPHQQNAHRRVCAVLAWRAAA